VRLTETQAQKRIAKSKSPNSLAASAAPSACRPDGMTSFYRSQNERVLGVGIVGAGAGELIAEGVLAIEMGALARDVALTIHPHPTLTER